jgi:hypothetical protein
VSDSKTTVRLAPDVRHSLEQWAEKYVSNLTVEINRSIRERAARERKQRQHDEAVA